MIPIYTILVVCLICSPLCGAVEVEVKSLPKPTGYVSDLAHVLNADDKDRLEVFCTKVEQELGVQFALVTIDSTGNWPIRDFALDLARTWGVGKRRSNQGVLLLLAIQDRKSDIETGRGIEPYLTDGFAGSTLRAMRPSLRVGDYDAALLSAAQAMASQIAKGKNIDFSGGTSELTRTPATDGHGGGIPGPLIILAIILLIWVLRRKGQRSRPYGGGFLTGVLLGNILRAGRPSSGAWGRGGGFGTNAGGGGGFGGFGGGDFGGGGASSDW